jgi:hypothetical protein
VGLYEIGVAMHVEMVDGGGGGGSLSDSLINSVEEEEEEEEEEDGVRDDGCKRQTRGVVL